MLLGSRTKIEAMMNVFRRCVGKLNERAKQLEDEARTMKEGGRRRFRESGPETIGVSCL